MKKHIILFSILACPLASHADIWYIKPVFGISQMSSVSGFSEGIGADDGLVQTELSSGFNAGLAVGYEIRENIALELLWEYRSNDSQVALADLTRFDEGNYASNFFFINGVYQFTPMANGLNPYVGLGIGVSQEIDIDLEASGVEQSLSGSGDVAYQWFAGVNYDVTDEVSLSSELRYSYSSNIDLEAENFSFGTIQDFDYDALTLQVGLEYRL